jgi:hypothetical protein
MTGSARIAEQIYGWNQRARSFVAGQNRTLSSLETGLHHAPVCHCLLIFVNLNDFSQA